MGAEAQLEEWDPDMEAAKRTGLLQLVLRLSLRGALSERCRCRRPRWLTTRRTLNPTTTWA